MRCRGDLSARWWLLALLGLVLLFAARTVSAQESEPSTTEEPTLSTVASTLRSSSAELVQRLDDRRTQADELSQSGTSIASQLSGAMQSDELSSSELAAQSTSTSQALADSVTASTATTTSLSDASASSTSLSEDLTDYVQQMTRSRDRWRLAALISAGVSLALAAGVTLAIVL